MTNKPELSYPAITADIISSHDATIASINLWLDGLEITVTGTAKRDNEDKYDAEIGAKLALGRALDSLSKKMLRQASGKVKCAEDNRIASKEAATKRETKKSMEQHPAGKGATDPIPEAPVKKAAVKTATVSAT